jgi:hypothetical protein
MYGDEDLFFTQLSPGHHFQTRTTLLKNTALPDF